MKKLLFIPLLFLAVNVLADTFGCETVKPDFLGGTVFQANNALCPSNGTLNYIVCLVSNTAGSTSYNFKVGIYSPNAAGNNPATLISSSAWVTFTPSGMDGWYQFDLWNQPTLTAGTTYYLASMANTGSNLGTFRSSSGDTGYTQYYISLTETDMPVSWSGTNSAAGRRYSIYAIYAPTGGASATFPKIFIWGDD
jgi:hypothetical protein